MEVEGTAIVKMVRSLRTKGSSAHLLLVIVRRLSCLQGVVVCLFLNVLLTSLAVANACCRDTKMGHKVACKSYKLRWPACKQSCSKCIRYVHGNWLQWRVSAMLLVCCVCLRKPRAHRLSQSAIALLRSWISPRQWMQFAKSLLSCWTAKRQGFGSVADHAVVVPLSQCTGMHTATHCYSACMLASCMQCTL